MTDTKRPPEKRSVGAPKKMTDGKRVNIYLDAESIDLAKKLGGGNVSKGIRAALKIASEAPALRARPK